MKASELIKEIQELMEQHGDFEIYEPQMNRHDGMYDGLTEFCLYIDFYDKERLIRNEESATRGLIEKYRHPDRWIYDKMDEKSVVGVVCE